MHIHILGIAGGGMTTPLALELKRHGHHVTGSDQPQIYPPASTQLRQAQIPINTTPISRSIDLVIVGSSYQHLTQPSQEFRQIKSLHIPYISATRYVANHLIKPNSILIAGPFGKTTITGLVAWILLRAKLKPSYLIGGQPINRIPSLKITDSPWSVVEADESINGLDTQAKFLYYPIKHLILTGTLWEHKESYSNESDNLTAFQKLVKRIPSNGILVYNQQDPNVNQILPLCRGQTIPYDFSGQFSSPLLGRHNLQNISAAYTLAHQLGIPTSTINSAISSYLGIARRLQIIGHQLHPIFIDDFSQSPNRIQQALETIKNKFPDYQIKVYLEPHATFLQYATGIQGLGSALTLATEVVLGKVHFSPHIPPTQRINARHFASEIGNKLKYIPLPSQIVLHYQQTLKPNEVLVHFSSGGLVGLQTFYRIVRHFKS